MANNIWGPGLFTVPLFCFRITQVFHFFLYLQCLYPASVQRMFFIFSYIYSASILLPYNAGFFIFSLFTVPLSCFRITQVFHFFPVFTVPLFCFRITQVFHFFPYLCHRNCRLKNTSVYVPLNNSSTKKEKLFLGRQNIGGESAPPPPVPPTSCL